MELQWAAVRREQEKGSRQDEEGQCREGAEKEGADIPAG